MRRGDFFLRQILGAYVALERRFSLLEATSAMVGPSFEPRVIMCKILLTPPALFTRIATGHLLFFKSGSPVSEKCNSFPFGTNVTLMQLQLWRALEASEFRILSIAADARHLFTAFAWVVHFG